MLASYNTEYSVQAPSSPNNYHIQITWLSSTGDVVVSSVQFQLTSELNAPTPTFTLTCTSTGGPATTVSWTVNNSAVTEDSAHITSQVLTDAENATYTNTLTVTGRLLGEYECTVSNNKPSSSTGILAVVGENYFQHEARLPKQIDHVFSSGGENFLVILQLSFTGLVSMDVGEGMQFKKHWLIFSAFSILVLCISLHPSLHPFSMIYNIVKNFPNCVWVA